MDQEKTPLNFEDDLRKLPKERKNSLKKTIIILSCIAVLIATVIVVLIVTKPAPPAQRVQEYVLNVNKEPTCVRVSTFDKGVRLPEESFTLIKKNGEWEMEGDELKLNQIKAIDIVSSTILYSSRTIEEKPTDEKLNEYGLKNPVRTIIFEFADSANITLHIGRRISTDGGFYAKLADKSQVYLISDVDGEELTMAKNMMVEMPIIVPSEAQSAIKNVAIKRNDEFIQIERSEDAGINYNYWNYTAPTAANCNDDAIKEFLTELVALSPDEYVGKEIKDEYGLKTPYLTVVTEAFENSYGLEVGNATKDNKYKYCRLNRGDVYKIATAKLETLEKFNALTVVQNAITKYHINFTDNVRIFDAKGDLANIVVKHDVTQNENGEDITSETMLNGQKLDPKVFSQFYVSFLEVAYDGILPKGAKTGALVFGYELKLKGNKTVKVEFLEYNDYSKAVRVNGETYYSTMNDKIDVMRQKTELLLEDALMGTT